MRFPPLSSQNPTEDEIPLASTTEAAHNELVKCGSIILGAGSFTLGEVLVQVELESSAAEAEHLGGLREQAGVGQAGLARGVDQQQGAHVTTLTLYSRRHRMLLLVCLELFIPVRVSSTVVCNEEENEDWRKTGREGVEIGR